MSAGRAVTRVVHRCNQAKEDRKLDLSSCQLTQVPDAVYLFMKHTELQLCDLSDNLIKRIPSKFGIKFPHVTELHLSGNQLAALPEELREMSALRVLDISHNHFPALPPVINGFSELRQLNAEKNSIEEVDVPKLKALSCLVEVNLQDNPLATGVYEQLMTVKLFTVLLTPRDPVLDALD